MAKKKADKEKINWIERLAPFALLVVPFILYANTLSHGFVLDDRAVIFQNKFVTQGFSGIDDILSTFYWKGYWNQNSGLYRPLSLIMFAIEWQLSPNNPAIHHLVQVLIYMLTGWLLYRLLKKIFSGYSYLLPFSVTLLFLAHPVHTEVVANIKSRDELLCLLFFLVTALILLKGKVLTWRKIALACCTYLLCLLSKEGGIMFLPFLVVLPVWLQDKKLREVSLRLWPLAVITVLWLCWHQYIVRDGGNVLLAYTYQDNALVACDNKLSQIATGVSILGSYMLKCIWPYRLSYDYSYNQIPCASFYEGNVILVSLLLFALLYVAVRYCRHYPVVSFGIAFFFVTIALTTNIFILIGATAADRFLYAPVLGFLMVLCWFIFIETRRWQQSAFYTQPVFLLAVLFSFYSYKTVVRNGDWVSDKTLFAADVNASPSSARVHYNYASLLINEPVTDEAERQLVLNEVIAELDKAAAIDSEYASIYVNLGVAYYQKKNYERAVMYLQRAVRLNPADNEGRHNLADAFFKSGQYDSSIYYHRLCVANNFVLQQTWNMLGTAFFNTKQYAEARLAFENGIAHDNSNASLYLNYGNVLGVLNQHDAAIKSFEKAYVLNPGDKMPLYYIATSYKLKGELQPAETYLNRYNNAH